MARRQGLPEPEMDWAVFLDVDGTLIEIAATPDKVEIPPDMVGAVSGLQEVLGGAVAIVSGRPLVELDGLMKPLVLPAAGLHGLECRGPDGSMMRDDRQAARLETVRRALARFAASHPGVFVEDKRLALALHYRAAPEAADEAKDLVNRLVAENDDTLGAVPGKMVVEIKAAHTNKGAVVEAFMKQPPFAGRKPVFIGDDYTDEDGFRTANRFGGLSIRVGPPPPGVPETTAHWECAGVRDLITWLKKFPSSVRQSA